MADFIAEALCATMGRGFSECFRKDIAVAVPDYIAIGLLLVIGKFGDGWGHSPYWFRWLFDVPIASSIDKEPSLTLLSERIIRGESFLPRQQAATIPVARSVVAWELCNAHNLNIHI